MHGEQVKYGVFDATKDFFTTLNRERWAKELETNIRNRDAICVIDARESPLPAFLTDRLTPQDIGNAEKMFGEMFGTDWKKNIEGKTYAVTYTKFGHGHKHQAYDMSLLLAHMTKSRVICFDPMDALSLRERNGINQARMIHKAMQDRNTGFLDELRELAKHPPASPVIFQQFDRATNALGIQIADLAFKNLPAQQETGNTTANHNKTFIDSLLDKYPQKLVRLLVEAQVRLTERSMAAASASIAASYGAEAIVTTHPNTIRALTPDALPWVPKRLRKRARHALQTIITLIPDNGYVMRQPDGNDHDPLTGKKLMDDLILSCSFAFVMKDQASWLKRGLHIVADDTVAKRFHEYWNIPESQLFPFGTMADTISAEHMERKWDTPERRILIASNGNGSNITDAMRAIDEIAAVSPTYLRDNGYHLDIFLADFPDRAQEIIQKLSKHTMEDQAEIIDYTSEYFDKKKSFGFGNDPDIRIHLAYAKGDAAGSELKQLMQREAHIEIRSPGENALTGAKVGTLELCTPPGGPNEIYNMIWAGRHGLSHAVNWTADPHAVPWQKTGVTADAGFIPDKHTQTLPILLSHLKENNRDRSYAKKAYERSNMHTGYAVTGLLVGEILRRNQHTVPDRDTVVKKLSAYMDSSRTVDRN